MLGFRNLESFIRGLTSALPSNTRGRSPVPELGTPGSERGVLSNEHSYRDPVSNTVYARAPEQTSQRHGTRRATRDRLSRRRASVGYFEDESERRCCGFAGALLRGGGVIDRRELAQR